MISYLGRHHCMDTRIQIKGRDCAAFCVGSGAARHPDRIHCIVLKEKDLLYKKEPCFCCSKLYFSAIEIRVLKSCFRALKLFWG